MSSSSIASSSNAKQNGHASALKTAASAAALTSSKGTAGTASSASLPHHNVASNSSLSNLANPGLSSGSGSTHGSSTNVKPVLNGVKIRARKAEKKATKHDASGFKEQLVQALQPALASTLDAEGEATDATPDFAKVGAALEANAAPLDFRRYVEPLFELLTTGTLLGIFFLRYQKRYTSFINKISAWW